MAVKKGRDPQQLTPREALFVLRLDESFGNATQAVLDAGYVPNGRRDQASDYAKRLLRRGRVVRAIVLLRERQAIAAGITVEGLKAKLWAAFTASALEGKNVVKLGKLLAEMTPGALVPRKVDVSGGLTLRELVVEAGKPEKPDEGGS